MPDTTPKPSLRDQILGADDMKREPVFVPQWGVTVFVRTLTGAERDEWENSILVRRGNNADVSLINIRAKLLVKCIVDENGKRIFRDDEAEALGRKAAPALEVLFTAAQKLNALTEQDEAELGKGLANGANGDSGFG